MADYNLHPSQISRPKTKNNNQSRPRNMAASKWRSVPLLALLIISFASTNCLARQVTTGGKDDKDNKPAPQTSLGLSVGLDGSYSWQYWQWSWGTPSPTWFPWGTSSLYCRPVNGCIGGNCNGFYLEFDYDHIGFSYNYNYMRSEASVKENDEMSPRKDGTRKRPEDGRSEADNQRDNDNGNNEKNTKRSNAKVLPGPN